MNPENRRGPSPAAQPSELCPVGRGHNDDTGSFGFSGGNEVGCIPGGDPRPVGILGQLGETALAYGALGWEVFPLGHCSKFPLVPKSQGGRGHLDATSDEQQIRSWWERNPQSNIGGRVPIGLAVVDVDPRHGGHLQLEALEREHGHLPVTLTARSGRCDGGRHLWCQHPGGDVTGRRLPNGLDLKTHDGYMVLPPSLHPDSWQPYSWLDASIPPAPMPDWLKDVIRDDKPQWTDAPLGAVDNRYVDAAIRKSCDRVLAAPAHEHHSTINAASFGLGRLVGAGLLDENRALAELGAAAARLCPKDHTSNIRCGLASGTRNPRSPKR